MVIWSEPAKDDLRIIFKYIAHDSLFYAEQVTSTIIEQSEDLLEHPAIGRVVPEINDENLRELLIYSYRIIYELSKDKIIVHAIIHAKRDFNKAFKYNE